MLRRWKIYKDFFKNLLKVKNKEKAGTLEDISRFAKLKKERNLVSKNQKMLTQ